MVFPLHLEVLLLQVLVLLLQVVPSLQTGVSNSLSASAGSGMHVSVREVCIPSEPDSAYFLRVAWKGRGLESGFQLLLTDGQDAGQETRGLSVCGGGGVGDADGAIRSGPPSGADRHHKLLQLQSDAADPDPAEALRELLTHSLQRGNHLKEENQNLKEENLKMRENTSASLQRVPGAELYSRFVLVVNEKKAKIRSLQEAEQKQQDAVKSADEEEDEYGGSTDEEEQQEVKRTHPPPPRLTRGNPQSSQTEKTMRSEPPAGSSKQQPPPRRSTEAAAVEDLFDDF
ncbi:hypothetical protein F7725_014984 [Dissostichus mawsoni]|uniref:XRCC4 coiled-coil domain-containing protein n=1 Tax=Dissostichus mawsoni TaxID=36200 RepID=A0A7J5YJ32_DISMA|nr:hypothetical protein F7725_014984 [Dissostichus mawsoni]